MPSIAIVYVDVLPVTGKIADGIAKALRDADDDVRKAARRWGKEIERGLGKPEVTVDSATKAAERKVEKSTKTSKAAPARSRSMPTPRRPAPKSSG